VGWELCGAGVDTGERGGLLRSGFGGRNGERTSMDAPRRMAVTVLGAVSEAMLYFKVDLMRCIDTAHCGAG
jgi:hypothetical protein